MTERYTKAWRQKQHLASVFCKRWPPIQVFGVEGRYATALYSAASKSKVLDNVEKDLKLVRETLSKDAPFREFCANPTLQRSAKVTAISQALDKMKVTPQTKNMFVILTENGRLSRINTVLDKFDQLMSAHRGEVHCVVRTAKALDRSAENELRAALNEFLKPGEKLQLTMEAAQSSPFLFELMHLLVLIVFTCE
ncbi:unnamed protein product [Calicophoron daubneyi]|uniref:Oligomycin sensitivity conferral protein n=1 Tax=Calicophoron daubneyi TaxID=300641 RepID=A0AAV2T2F4_CALDB